MGSRASLFSLFLLVGACGGSSPTSSPDTTAARTSPLARDDAAAILAKMNERYASAKTYADEGTFRIVYRETDGREKHTSTGRFRTRWRAPDRLVFVMFEGRRPQPLALSFSSELDARSVAESLTKMHGPSNGVTGLVPLWLVEGFRPTQRYELKGRAPCGTAECHALQSFSDPTDTTTLFVDTTTFALRRVLRHSLVTPKALDAETLAALPPAERDRARLRQLDPFVTDEDIALTPSFDGPLEAADFAVDPTASSSPDRPGR